MEKFAAPAGQPFVFDVINVVGRFVCLVAWNNSARVCLTSPAAFVHRLLCLMSMPINA